MGSGHRAPFDLLRGVCIAICLAISQGGRHLQTSPSPGTARSQELILLEFAGNLTNFKKVIDANHLRGWSHSSTSACGGAEQAVTSDSIECSPENQIYRNADRNSWTGVTCDTAGEVVCIHLPSLDIEGPASALSVLGGLTSLRYINFASNKLKGLLPEHTARSLRSLQLLDLSHNAINGTLKSEWGSERGWTELQQLNFEANTLYGTLPAAWGRNDSWSSLVQLNVADNRLHGSIPGLYGDNASWPSLQTAILEPGNSFCGAVPGGFEAVRATGEYVTGPALEPIANFNDACTAANTNENWSGDVSGDELSHSAIAGIITGEVLLGLFLLLFAGTIHRRYRWRHERSWVLFDWDVVADTPPKPFLNLGGRFGFGSKPQSGNSQFGAENAGFLANGSASPGKQSGSGPDTGELRVPSPPLAPPPAPAPTPAPAAHQENGLAQNGLRQRPAGQRHERRRSSSAGNFTDLICQDSLMTSEDVVIQQNTDGSLRQLGNGSFGKVYKGVLQDVHEVAVKVFEGYAGQAEQALLLREISILRSCRNKNIVQFFGVTVHDGDIWMIMELMDGNLFRHLARGHHCTWYFRGRSIALDIARGMHFLHSRRIIHMDLKSPNILLSSSGTAKIADVGLARVMGSESIANQVCAGTMHWMAPEVLMHGRCTEKADIFSFGVIMWEICTAEAPSRGRMTPVSTPDECPEEVARLIEWCMDEDPDKRPSALEIINRIQAIPVTARPVPQPPWYAR